ncbi:hypothetical protein [Sphingomonas sp. YL-JM2C]
MRFLCAGAAALLVTACATITTSDVRQRAPTATYQTSKPANAVAQCLAENLGKFGNPSIYSTSAGLAVAFNLEGSTILLIDIENGGTVIVRRTGIMAYKRETEACL